MEAADQSVTSHRCGVRHSGPDGLSTPCRARRHAKSVGPSSSPRLRCCWWRVAGEALLWGIDTHNRTAHIGVALRPAFRGHGLGVDVLHTLCEYGFAVRGLQRLQIDTLTDNTPMLAAATRVGFTREGTLRRSSWVYGTYVDEAIFGLLADEWTPRR
ncbi:GNAT family protein [Streptacidiphilus sp. ASG 303]|uniref:GNAT family N-acetyltransferase n=1 Tax=Streptacidiphilus sp. ASG 303 TaxID=2896847 RepID=UPI0027E14852|nr:GNAT family protein [Streptacidiphilus sp. ASG 303]